MVENEWNGREFTSFEYKEIQISEDKASFYLDCYENFGWTVDDKFPPQRTGEKIQIKMKRNRKIVNKVELTRLQRNFEASIDEIDTLENSKTKVATAAALVIGVTGTGFMAGSVFAVKAQPPIIWLCVLLAIPGFLGWILPYFAYQRTKKKKHRRFSHTLKKSMMKYIKFVRKDIHYYESSII